MPFDLIRQSQIDDNVARVVLSKADTATRERSTMIFVAGAAISAVAIIALMRSTNLKLLFPIGYAAFTIAAFAAGIMIRPVLLRQPETSRKVVFAFAEYLGLLGLVSLLGVLATYPLACISRNYSDAVLLRCDEALHFDWSSWYRLVVMHKVLETAGRLFYDSVFLTPVLLCAHFAYFRQRDRAHLLIASYSLSIVITLVLFALFPAKGPLATIWHGAIPYMPKSGLYQAMLIDGLKHHTIHDVRIDDLRGLVSVPSFHTTAAVLFIMAAWPFRGIRWPVLAVNVAMLASIPVEGTHYLTDMIAGVLVAIISQRTMSFVLRGNQDHHPDMKKIAFATAG